MVNRAHVKYKIFLATILIILLALISLFQFKILSENKEFAFSIYNFPVLVANASEQFIYTNPGFIKSDSYHADIIFPVKKKDREIENGNIEEDGLIFKKIENGKYNLVFSLENNIWGMNMRVLNENVEFYIPGFSFKSGDKVISFNNLVVYKFSIADNLVYNGEPIDFKNRNYIFLYGIFDPETFSDQNSVEILEKNTSFKSDEINLENENLNLSQVPTYESLIKNNKVFGQYQNDGCVQTERKYLGVISSTSLENCVEFEVKSDLSPNFTYILEESVENKKHAYAGKSPSVFFRSGIKEAIETLKNSKNYVNKVGVLDDNSELFYFNLPDVEYSYKPVIGLTYTGSNYSEDLSNTTKVKDLELKKFLNYKRESFYLQKSSSILDSELVGCKSASTEVNDNKILLKNLAKCPKIAIVNNIKRGIYLSENRIKNTDYRKGQKVFIIENPSALDNIILDIK